MTPTSSASSPKKQVWKRRPWLRRNPEPLIRSIRSRLSENSRFSIPTCRSTITWLAVTVMIPLPDTAMALPYSAYSPGDRIQARCPSLFTARTPITASPNATRRVTSIRRISHRCSTTPHKVTSAAEQGQDPPVDPEEMANPDTACVVWKLSLSKYKFFFEQVWGTGSLDIAWPADVAKVCSTPKGAAIFGTNATPLNLIPSERTRANQAYDEFGQSIASYETSSSVSPFTSKFDAYLAGSASLTAAE